MNIYDKTDERVRKYYRKGEQYYQLLPVAMGGKISYRWKRCSKEDIQSSVLKGLMDAIPMVNGGNEEEYYRMRAADDAKLKTTYRDTKNTALEAMTKTALVAMVQQLMHERNVLETDKERVKEEYNVVANERSKLHTHLNAARADAESWKSMATNWERECEEHKKQVLLLEADRASLSMKLETEKTVTVELREKAENERDKRRQIERRFLKQVELAGEAVKLNPFNH